MPESVKASTDPKVAADVIAEEAYQRVKLTHGVDGSATDASASDPLPISDAGGKLSVDDGGGSLTVDGSVTVSGDVFDSAAYEKLEFLQALLEGTLTVNASGAVSLSAALPAGTNAIGQVDPRGNVAHDGADSGNPIKVGGRARTELPAAVAQNDRVDVIADKFGRQLVAPAPLDQRVSATLNRTNTESGQLLAAVASTAYVITAIKVVNGHATVGTKVEILDGETVKDKGFAGPLGGGWNLSDPNGLFVGTANTKLAAKCATTGANVDIFVSGYKIPA